MEVRERGLRDEFRHNIKIPSEAHDLEERQSLIAVLDHRHRPVFPELCTRLLHPRVKLEDERERPRLRFYGRSSSDLAPGL